MGRVILYSVLCVLLMLTGYLFLGSSEEETLPPPSPPAGQETAEPEVPLPHPRNGEIQNPYPESMKSSVIPNMQTKEEPRLTATKDKELF